VRQQQQQQQQQQHTGLMQQNAWCVQRVNQGNASFQQLFFLPSLSPGLTCAAPLVLPLLLLAAGYPFRRSFADFLEQFWQLYPAGRQAAASGDPAAAAAACRELLASTGMTEGLDYQVGPSLVPSTAAAVVAAF
jgi:hypothetical protein